MGFEWDEEKSKKTKEDRGISFEDAMVLWLDREALDIPARSEGETRWARIGKIHEKIFIAFFTNRAGKIRVISVRRARIKEEALYVKE